jgi:capsular polysaccharide biosynthesis protein/Mrp family chromosome partitioning ATPase
MRNDLAHDAAGDTPAALRLLTRHWRMVLALTLVSIATAALYAFTAQKTYEAEADLLVTPFSDSGEAFASVGILRDPSTSVYTAGRLVELPDVTTSVRRRLGLTESRATLLDSITVRPVQQSSVVAILARAESPRGAARRANAFAESVIDHQTRAFQRQVRAAIARLQARLRESQEQGRKSETEVLQERLADLGSFLGSKDPTLQILKRAEAPESPKSPRPLLAILIAAVAGLTLGIGAALAMDLFHRRIRTIDDLPQDTPVLGAVPNSRGRTPETLLEGADADATVGGFRRVRAALAATGKDSDFPRSIVVTSPESERAGTLVATHLALALAATGMRVVLVDAAMRANAVARAFGVASDETGLADALSGEHDASSSLVSVSSEDVSLGLLIPGGEGPLDLVVPERVQRLLRQLSGSADVVVVDAPAFSESADALTWAAAVESVLVAVRLEQTGRAELDDLLRGLERRGVHPSGFVVITRKRVRVTDGPSRMWTVIDGAAGAWAVEKPLRPAAGSKR